MRSLARELLLRVRELATSGRQDVRVALERTRPRVRALLLGDPPRRALGLDLLSQLLDPFGHRVLDLAKPALEALTQPRRGRHQVGDERLDLSLATRALL